jgi:hypothetical protein
MTDFRKRQLQQGRAWTLLGFSLSILGMYCMDRGVWRHVVMGAAAAVLVLAIYLMLRARWRGECGGARQC